MTEPTMRRLATSVAAAMLAFATHATAQSVRPPDATLPPAASAPAATGDKPWQPWFISTSVYTKHFHYDPAHNDNQHMLAVEWRHDERYGLGFAVFDNSFDQPSQYVFASARFKPFDSDPEIYIRLTGGIVHGYKGEYRNKIPLNSSGYAPIILPMVGYCRWHVCGEVVFFGTNGATLVVGARF